MKRSDVFKSRFLNSGNVTSPIVVTVAFAKMETLENSRGETDEKCIVYFSDCKQVLALNGINWDSIEQISGESDTDRWPDTRIEIYPSMTEVSGKPKACIRVRAPQEMPLKAPTKPAPTTPTKPATAKPAATGHDDDMRDEIPF
jgi:hypothetical protein